MNLNDQFSPFAGGDKSRKKSRDSGTWDTGPETELSRVIAAFSPIVV